MNKIVANLFWVLVAIVAAFYFGMLALNKGESVSATWLVVAAICIYMIGYRFYSRFIAEKVFELDDKRATPALINNDGKDFVPTHKAILFGHHFAAIAGAGPLVGPILAAQMGYLPSMIWLLVGVVLAGAVHDFAVLFLSMRRNGKSLGEMIKEEMGKVTGGIAMVGILFIMFIIVAILAMVVVNALAESAWGLFTIAMTIPIAIFMGIYMRFLRPGRVGEASIIGFVLLLLALYYGHAVADPNHAWHNAFLLSKQSLALIIIAYGFIASILPVWFLLAPRDYLSTFLKIGVIVIMAAGIIWVNPELKMLKITEFIDGTGTVFAGSIFPFLFITIACGAISGFHALISSGTSPKMLEKESHARMVGYGSMLMESLVGIMALVAACILEPGLYFALNSPLATLDPTATSATMANLATVEENLKHILQNAGFAMTPETLSILEQNFAQGIPAQAAQIGETTILSRTGGAPTFAIGLTHIMHEIAGGKEAMAFWYHFAILFEALFILTAVDAGTRSGRFLIQDILGNIYKPMADTKNFLWGVVASFICVCGWGYLLYQGTIDPLGGIYTLWPLFGAANQMLAGIALLLATVVLFKMGKEKYSWVTIVPAFWVLLTTLWASFQKLLPANGEKIHDAVSHVATAQIWIQKKAEALAAGNEALVQRANAIIHNNVLDAVLCGFFMIVVFVVLFETLKICYLITKGKAEAWPLKEEAYKKASDYTY
ncbi:carbon starvation protein A [Campylobacter sp. MIT 99-7217]|uniref:carbon starvation CstA family protein n=1 Tax=Campylobacter sp. MIT 99-7217 TaxID=535091 RepID=UPI001157352D|nr:carbon starvation CstA family protein [Campylobacter sp. MIT 99-7217]TQR34510.1 carbon starvation protein A [Campylobacter sp. MIT 99-7217]